MLTRPVFGRQPSPSLGIILVGLLCLTVIPEQSRGQAYCALRDPVTTIYDAYPGADSFRSVVRTVDESVRGRVSQSVPFPIHFNELGRHTLYVATKESRPVGIIHVRSERGSWGLVEIAWALDSELRIEGFTFQRCRSPQRGAIESPQFVDQLVGKGYRQLIEMLDDSGMVIAGDLGVDGPAKELAATVLRSAIKTILVTMHAWEEPLEVIQSMGQGYAAFPAASSFEKMDQVYSEEAIRQIERHFGGHGTGTLVRNSALGYQFLDKNKKTVGHVFRTDWRSMEHQHTLWWTVTPDRTIRSISADGGWLSDEVELSFSLLVGMSYDDVSTCSTTSEAIAAEILIVSNAHD